MKKIIELQEPFLFAFCDRCRTLFINGLGRHIEHICRRRIDPGGKDDHLTEARVSVEWSHAEHVEDVARMRWFPVK